MPARLRRVHRSVALNGPPEDVYRFHLDTRNAALIAPRNVQVEILSGEFPLVEGAHVTARMRPRPFPGWQTWHIRVAELVPYTRMVDEGVSTPFAEWRHAHIFHAIDGGTSMTDSVEYLLPGGSIVNAIVGPAVDRVIAAVLGQRHRATRRLFRSGRL